MSEPTLDITAIPAFSDNYIWLVQSSHEPGSRACAVVDPGEHEPVLEALRAHDLDLRYILLTHHHWDHSGGIAALLEHYQAQVFGPDDERLDEWCQPCHEGDTVNLPDLGLSFGVLDIPCHTSSHIAFHGHGLVFSGDTLFSIGCGRFFEGTPAQMQDAMDKLRDLPPETLVYCGHEYTVSNCDFALQVEPDNAALQARAAQARAQRAAGEITLPSRLAEELVANPFLRTREATVVAAARSRDANASPGAFTMGVIRSWKDAS